MTRNQIEYWRNVEDKRAHLANEQENLRSHLAQEAENRRSNMARESQNYQNYLLDKDTKSKSLVETKRSNLSSEKIRRREASTADYSATTNRLAHQEKMRSNLANEQQAHNDLLSRNAHYLRQDEEQVRTNLAREGETYRSNKQNEMVKFGQLQEQKQHNRNTEFAQTQGNYYNLVGNLAGTLGRVSSSAMTVRR